MVDKVLMFKIIEEMNTIQGEGLFAGRPTHFIRLANCNLDCTWCDSNRGIPQEGLNDYHLVEVPVLEHVDSVLNKLYEYTPSGKAEMPGNFCFTGGEPLLYMKEIALWLSYMVGNDNFRSATIETGGGVAVRNFRKVLAHQLLTVDGNGKNFDEISKAVKTIGKVSVCVDYKLTSAGSGAHGRMIEDNFTSEVLGFRDSVKLVCFDETDLHEAVEVIRRYRFDAYTNLFLSPCWDNDLNVFREKAKMIAGAVQQLQDENIFAGISIQQHKIYGMK